MSYWKLLATTLVVAVLSCSLAIFLTFVLFKLGLIPNKSVIGYFVIFIAIAGLGLSIYNFKKGIIFSWQGMYLFYKPSRDFYLKLWFQLIFFAIVLLLGLYSIILNYLK